MPRSVERYAPERKREIEICANQNQYDENHKRARQPEQTPAFGFVRGTIRHERGPFLGDASEEDIRRYAAIESFRQGFLARPRLIQYA